MSKGRFLPQTAVEDKLQPCAGGKSQAAQLFLDKTIDFFGQVGALCDRAVQLCIAPQAMLHRNCIVARQNRCPPDVLRAGLSCASCVAYHVGNTAGASILRRHASSGCWHFCALNLPLPLAPLAHTLPLRRDTGRCTAPRTTRTGRRQTRFTRCTRLQRGEQSERPLLCLTDGWHAAPCHRLPCLTAVAKGPTVSLQREETIPLGDMHSDKSSFLLTPRMDRTPAGLSRGASGGDTRLGHLM